MPMTAGYSGTPQARKLGLKAGQRVALDEPPPGWQLREPPDGLLVPGADGAADLIIAFFRAEIELADRLPALARRIFPAGALWAAWPRRAGGHDSDITDNVVRRHALGLREVRVLDEVHQRDVPADRAPLHPPQTEPDRLDRRTGDPHGGEKVTLAAARDNIQPERISLPGGNDRAHNIGGGNACGDGDPALALRRRHLRR